MRRVELVSRRMPAVRPVGSSVAAAVLESTPATIFSDLDPLDWTWLHAGLGETTTNDNGGGGSLLSAGGSNLVLDALADQNAVGAYNCSQTTSARPRIETAGFNGDPCWAVRAGESQRIASGATCFGPRISGNDTPAILGGVAQCFRTDATQLPFSYGGSASNHFMELVLNSTGFFARKNAGSNIDAPVGGSGSPNTNRFWWLFYTNSAGTTGTLEINGVVVANGVSWDAASITLDVFAMGCLRRGTFTTFMDGRIRTFFAAAGSAAVAKASQLRTWLATLTVSKSRPQFIAAGDSITHTANGENSWMVQLAAAMPGTDFINNGVPGAVFSDVDTTDPSLFVRYTYSNYDAGRAANVYRLGWGLNDLLTGVTAATLATKYQNAITAIKTAFPGAKVIVPTLFDCTSFSAGQQTERATFNTDVRTNAVSSWGADAVHDQEAITPEAASDTNIFSDGKHQTALGQGYQVTGRNGALGMQQHLLDLGCAA